MNNITVYRAGRGEGKTSWIISQMSGLLSTADGPLNIAIVVPSSSLIYQFRERHVPVDIYTEATVLAGYPRGRQYDYVFVDNADLFYENPLRIANETAPGKPAFLTYTPLDSNVSSLPKPVQKPEPGAMMRSEIDLMIAYMLAYIRWSQQDD